MTTHSSQPTKTNTKPPSLLKSWDEGVIEFNLGHYWNAHERWEQGWKDLIEPEKTYVQSLIQTCGVFHLLIVRNRLSGAYSLCESALEKYRRTKIFHETNSVYPKLEIIGLEMTLEQLLAIRLSSVNSMQINWLEFACSLTARLIRNN